MIQRARLLHQGFIAMMNFAPLPTMVYFLVAQKSCPANTMLSMEMEAQPLDTLLGTQCSLIE